MKLGMKVQPSPLSHLGVTAREAISNLQKNGMMENESEEPERAIVTNQCNGGGATQYVVHVGTGNGVYWLCGAIIIAALIVRLT